jgi:hypothetical protein
MQRPDGECDQRGAVVASHQNSEDDRQASCHVFHVISDPGAFPFSDLECLGPWFTAILGELSVNS